MKEPKIRFNEFKGEWKEVTLGEIAPLIGGYAFQSANFEKTGIPIVRISNILDSGIVGGDFAKYKCFEGDILFRLYDGDTVIAMSGATTGKVAVVKTQTFLYQNQRVGKFSRTDKIYYPFVSIFVSSKKFTKELNKKLTASAQPNASSKDIDSVRLSFPSSKDEQQKIASFFTTLDAQISASTSRLASLKQIKAASLQAMFPQEGETVPKLRFKGFEGEWDKEKADSIFKTFNEKNRPDLPVLSATQDKGMVTRESIGYNIFHDKANEATYKHILPGQFVIHLRSFQGGFAHSEYEGIASPAYTIMDFRDKELHDDYYWRYVFMSKEFIKRLELVTYGIRDGRSISYDEFKDMTFRVPCKAEQRAIASYFTNLDRQITLQSQRLEKLKQIKAACLDKMFV